MKRRWMVPAGLVLAGLLVAVVAGIALTRGSAGAPIVINGIAAPPLPALDPEEVRAGERLYTQWCAACHGADLKGQPEWRVPLESGLYPAPPHDETGHTWHHGDALLTEIVRDGASRTPTAMPGFSAQISDDEIGAILTYLKSTWGREEREFQWWVTATQE